MKLWLLCAALLLASALTACSGSIQIPASSAVNSPSVTPAQTTPTAMPTTTTTTTPAVPVTDPLPPATVTTPAPVTEPEGPIVAPVSPDPLSALEFPQRRILYTAETVTLVNDADQKIARLGADHSVLAVTAADGSEKILYAGWLCQMDADAYRAVPSDATCTKQELLGGIYYPAAGKLVAIDAGHQRYGMKEKEPNGPGSTVMKAMVSTGTAGVTTRIAERELNLAVSLYLRDELISRGYGVVMIREVQEVSISNVQRALIANAYEADAFVRIHANGSTNREVNGALTICQTENNPYNAALYAQSYALSQCLLEAHCAATGVKQNRITRTDTMTGINWANIPVTIMEMGYMSNSAEDVLMATDAFRQNAAIGMANGLDAYFALDAVQLGTTPN